VPAWRRAALLCVLPAALLPRAAQAAAYLPGADAASAAPASAAEGPANPDLQGLRWTLAPVRTQGSIALDLRRLRLEDGSTTSQALLYHDIDVASYLWQPWFAQVRAGLGILAERDVRSTPGIEPVHSGNASLTGRLALAVFPSSRFPFELRADVSDSRVSGDSLGADYRSQRLGLTQSWRPLRGNTQLMVDLEHSRLSSDPGVDTVDHLQTTAFHQDGAHSLEFSAAVTRNRREDRSDSALGTSASALDSQLGNLGLRHGWRPDARWNVDSLASWSRFELRRRPQDGAAAGGDDLALASDLRQVASYATWRPHATSLFQPGQDLLVSGSLRWADSGIRSLAVDDPLPLGTEPTRQRVRSLFGGLGLSRELGRDWRAGASASAGLVKSEDGQGRLARNLTASLGYAPGPVSLGDSDWRYTPSATTSLTAGDVRRRDAAAAGSGSSGGSTPPSGDLSTEAPGQRRTVGAQVEHGLARSVALAGGRGSLSLGLTQSLGLLRASPSTDNARAIAHGASAYWQSSPGGFGSGDGNAYSYVGLSASDVRNWAPQAARFQLVNLQVSRRQQIARHSSWSGDLTLQASHNDLTEIDAFSGELRLASQGWQRYTNGNLSYEDGLFLGIPRLRWTVLLSLHSQQFESRSFGDIDAPRERVTESLESRLDWQIGKLETRLAARWARVDGREVTALQARLLRRY
jgi:hypothetical protein